jgi:hypothetical protein
MIDSQPMRLHRSCPAIKSDDDLTGIHNSWNFACPVGIFQHLIKIIRGCFDIDVFYFLVFFIISFTSRSRIRSATFPKYQNFI